MRFTRGISRRKKPRVELLKTVPELLAANKCPDFIEDEGHYFGTDLPDDDKRALIEYLKTFYDLNETERTMNDYHRS